MDGVVGWLAWLVWFGRLVGVRTMGWFGRFGMVGCFFRLVLYLIFTLAVKVDGATTPKR